MFLLPAGQPVMQRKLRLQRLKRGFDLPGHPRSFLRSEITRRLLPFFDLKHEVSNLACDALSKAHGTPPDDEGRGAVNGYAIFLLILDSADSRGVLGRNGCVADVLFDRPPYQHLKNHRIGKLRSHAIEGFSAIKPTLVEIQFFHRQRLSQRFGDVHDHPGQDADEIPAPMSRSVREFGDPDI